MKVLLALFLAVVTGAIFLTPLYAREAYDADCDGAVDRGEVVQALTDYYNYEISKDEALAVVSLYLEPDQAWPRAQSDPPEWIFTDDVREGDRATYQEEMERVRGFFSYCFGYETSAFTVLVGREEPLRAIYEEVTGVEPRDQFFASGWVFKGREDKTFLVVKHRKPITTYNVLAHEYIHVLQYELSGWADGSETRGIDLGDGDDFHVLWAAPDWHKEGFAVYGNYLYAATRPEWPSLVPNQFFPYRWLECNPDVWEDAGAELRSQENGCFFYDLAFLGSIFLMEELPAITGVPVEAAAWLDYWKLLAEADAYWYSTLDEQDEGVYRTSYVVEWKPAFEETFGISADDFYAAFTKWTLSGVVDERATLGSCPYTVPSGAPSWRR